MALTRGSRFDSSRFRAAAARITVPGGAPLGSSPSRPRCTAGVVTTILTCVVLGILYSVKWSETVRVEEGEVTFRRTENLCSPNSLQIEEALHPIPVAPVAWLSSAAAPIHSRDPKRVRCAGPDILFDENNEATCFSFSGGHGGVTLVSNSSRYRISHFTLDNSRVSGRINPTYYPMGGSLWGLLEGELPAGLEDVVISRVSAVAAYILLGSFCFVPEAGPAQTYAVEGFLAPRTELQFSVFYLEISSNWGGSHTCISRLRLHELN